MCWLSTTRDFNDPRRLRQCSAKTTTRIRAKRFVVVDLHLTGDDSILRRLFTFIFLEAAHLDYDDSPRLDDDATRRGYVRLTPSQTVPIPAGLFDTPQRRTPNGDSVS